MAFNSVDQTLIDECSKDTIDLERIKGLIADGARVNAFDEEYEQSLYDEILDYYTFEGRERRVNMSNLPAITELFMENGLILSPNPDDRDYFSLGKVRFLPPETASVDTFKMLLHKGDFSLAELDAVISDTSLDLHTGDYYFFDLIHNYSKEESLKYYLELIYWACAYSVKYYSEKCTDGMRDFDWFDRERNKIELVFEEGSSFVFIEDLKTHCRKIIDGWR